MRLLAVVLLALLAVPAAAQAKPPNFQAVEAFDGSYSVALTRSPRVKRLIIRWGDGTRPTKATRHRYKTPGTYTIRARAIRRHRKPRTFTARVLARGPVAPHHLVGYLVSDTLSCAAVSQEGGTETTSCGTFLSIDGEFYDPTTFVPVTSYQSGAGTVADPFVVTRVVRAGGRVELVQTSRSVTGSDTAALESYALRTVDGTQHQVVLYRTVDCADKREGTLGMSGGAGCRAPGAPTTSALFLLDRGQAGHAMEGRPGSLLEVMRHGDDFTNAARFGRHDTAIGLSWRVTLPTTSAATVTQASQLVFNAG